MRLVTLHKKWTLYGSYLVDRWITTGKFSLRSNYRIFSPSTLRLLPLRHRTIQRSTLAPCGWDRGTLRSSSAGASSDSSKSDHTSARIRHNLSGRLCFLCVLQNRHLQSSTTSFKPSSSSSPTFEAFHSDNWRAHLRTQNQNAEKLRYTPLLRRQKLELIERSTPGSRTRCEGRSIES